jgi:hypothetical protein
MCYDIDFDCLYGTDAVSDYERTIMTYIENPKTRGSGILCAIPQSRSCPMRCADCFFQSGRSYLEPLADNLPNVPTQAQAAGKIVRMNDGNDSNVDREVVEGAARSFPNVFFNTAIPVRLGDFPGPVVFTSNPGKRTDGKAMLLADPPQNIMFVRARVNTWNAETVLAIVDHYTTRGIVVVLTFMAYYTQDIPDAHRSYYAVKKRTINSYWVITDAAYAEIVARYKHNRLVTTCGADNNTYSCVSCGVCSREYKTSKERICNG